MAKNYDFSDLDASLAQLSADFAGIESGINNLRQEEEDPFAEFLEPQTVNTPIRRVNSYKNNKSLTDSPNKTPENSRRKNASNKDTPGQKGNFASSKKNSQPNVDQNGPLYFQVPELVDMTDASMGEIQRYYAILQEQFVRMAEEANTEIQGYYNQIRLLDEDNAKAFKTIQDLQSDLKAQGEDWKNSDKQLKAKISRLEADVEKLRNQQIMAPAGNNSASQAEIERYKTGLRTLNGIKTNLENRVRQLELDIVEVVTLKENEIMSLKTSLNYLNEEKKALEETFQDFTSAGLSTANKEQYEKQIKSQQIEIEALQREVTGLKSERSILQSQVEQMGNDLSALGDSESVPQLKLKIRKLEGDLEKGNLKIRRLVAAIKADRTQSEEKINELQAERDEQEQRADKFESKTAQLIEMVRAERRKRQEDTLNQAALDAARQALQETEIQIHQANEAASVAERALQQKEQELQKVLLFGKKKAREAQNAIEDLKVMEEKSNKLVEAIKSLKEENQKLKAGTGQRLSRSLHTGVNTSEELEAANQRNTKLEQALRKLRQRVADLEAEAADKEKTYEDRLQTAENRILAAEERAKNALLSIGGGPSVPLAPGPPPPPPPPLPKLKLNYEIKINKTGQSSFIQGEPGKPINHRNVLVDSIVDAIKKGVTLKRTGLREYDDSGDLNSVLTSQSSTASNDDFNVEDAFAAMTREIAVNKQKRERNKQQVQVEEKKKGGELDNLLAELADLDALIQ